MDDHIYDIRWYLSSAGRLVPSLRVCRLAKTKECVDVAPSDAWLGRACVVSFDSFGSGRHSPNVLDPTATKLIPLYTKLLA